MRKVVDSNDLGGKELRAYLLALSLARFSPLPRP
jgi:hypothetical protein